MAFTSRASCPHGKVEQCCPHATDISSPAVFTGTTELYNATAPRSSPDACRRRRCWSSSSDAPQSIAWNALPWILVAIVSMKIVAAAWVGIRLHDRRLLSDRALVTGAMGWLATVLAFYSVFVWFADSPAIPRYFLGAIAILNVPLARVSAAPLALEWSRHK